LQQEGLNPFCTLNPAPAVSISSSLLSYFSFSYIAFLLLLAFLRPMILSGIETSGQAGQKG
jgi:hypothetical protein